MEASAVDPSPVTDAASSPIMVYAAIIFGVLIAAATAVPKILGPIGTGIAKWAEQRRQERIAQDDADIRDLKRQNENLELSNQKKDREFSEYRRRVARREARWRIEKNIHDRWDYQAQQALVGHEPPFDLAPEYMTPDPPCEQKEDPL